MRRACLRHGVHTSPSNNDNNNNNIHSNHNNNNNNTNNTNNIDNNDNNDNDSLGVRAFMLGEAATVSAEPTVWVWRFLPTGMGIHVAIIKPNTHVLL